MKTATIVITVGYDASDHDVDALVDKLEGLSETISSLEVSVLERPRVLPVVHLNGTGRKMLTEGYEEAHDAIQKALERINQIEFNPRDYYVVGPEAWRNATDDREAVKQALAGAAQHMMTHLEHLYSNE